MQRPEPLHLQQCLGYIARPVEILYRQSHCCMYSAFASSGDGAGRLLSFLVPLQEIKSIEGLSAVWKVAHERILRVVFLVSPASKVGLAVDNDGNMAFCHYLRCSARVYDYTTVSNYAYFKGDIMVI